MRAMSARWRRQAFKNYAHHQYNATFTRIYAVPFYCAVTDENCMDQNLGRNNYRYMTLIKSILSHTLTCRC